ncbi:hypothetical protein IFM89_029551 [Coptis chinensis]|uniref:Uncharacterized protein n=1 Tax=Coptis chinensis TaxID=261450 RepID=A0A835H0K9_9MAGN|nr:hypothetical protein IFM89_029551 [Coptis chinensis]
MQRRVLHSPVVLSRGRRPLLSFFDYLPCSTNLSTTKTSPSLRYRKLSRLSLVRGTVRAQESSNISIGPGGFDGREENDNQKGTLPAKEISKPEKPLIQVPLEIYANKST